MDQQEQLKEKKDSSSLIIIFCIIVAVFAFFSSVDVFWKKLVISNVILSLVVGGIGKERKIGFSNAFLWSFLLSPLVGVLIAFNSPKIKDEEYKSRMMELTGGGNAMTASVADELHKLNELKKEGVISEDEFNAQKDKLLNT